ncbi:uncharacterized protein LY89DRAFT_7501 [Mollisia scopiformis]|uniref:Uncharacterized protein n=1 Tax=Mollisia scopiformis TaxID=149040 RepID=A0A194XUP7_MOLSC|nr:uncharacterized protein LY89DRAFT_7501 [Mollisia scopiformis]KUJ23933.1 hypothetical protein LY89DRAFT_7501 [Mollisia scopiformis]
MATGLAVWLGSAKALYGSVSIASTGELLPCMYGCLASTFSPLPYSVLITIIKPQNFDWNDFLKEKLAFGDSSSEVVEQEYTTVSVSEDDEPTSRTDPRWLPYMRRWTLIAAIWSAATFLGHWVLWPLPMYAARFTFSKNVSLPMISITQKRFLRIGLLAVLLRLACDSYYLAVGNALRCGVLPDH